MTEKKVTYRASLEGGAEVRREWHGIGETGQAAHQKIAKSQQSAAASARVFERQIQSEERAFRALKASVDPAYAAQIKYEKAERQVSLAVKRGIVDKKEAAQVLDMLKQQTLSHAGTVAALPRAYNASSMAVGNMTSQFNDIGVMLAAGQNPLQLAIQQGTQIGQVFQQTGAKGKDAFKLIAQGAMSMVSPINLITIGTIAAAGVMVNWLTKSKEGTDDWADSLDAAHKKIIELERDNARMLRGFKSEHELVLADAVDEQQQALARVVELTQKLDQLPLAGRRESQRTALQENLSEAQQALTLAQEKLDRLRREAEINETLQSLGQNITKHAKEYVAARLEAHAEGQKLLAQMEQETALRATIAVFGEDSAEVARLRADAERAALEELMESKGYAAELREELRQSLEVQIAMERADISGPITVAAQEARILYEELGLSMALAQKIAAMGPQGLAPKAPQGGRGGDPRAMGGSVSDWQNREAIVFLETWTPPKPERQARSGGGAAASNRAMQQEMREAERIIEATRTAQERYNDEVARASELLQAGKIDQETYTRYVAQLEKTLESAANENRQFQQVVTMAEDAIVNAVLGQAGAFDQLRDAIKRAAVEYLLFGKGMFAGPNSSFGGILGGVFSSIFKSFDGGGWTGDGPRSGGLDGKGGYLAMVHPREQVIDTTKGQGSASRSGDPMVPFVAIGDGVQVQWMREAQARNAQMLGRAARVQQSNMGAQIEQLQLRGVA